MKAQAIASAAADLVGGEKIYLAGPMTGLPDLNFPAFHAAAESLRAQGRVVFNPAELGFGANDYREALTACLAWICAEAEALVVLPGWEKSPGAQAEVATAYALGLQVLKAPEAS